MEKEPIKISLKLFIVVVLSAIALILTVVYGLVNAIKAKSIKLEPDMMQPVAQGAQVEEVDISNALVQKLYSYIIFENAPISDPGTELSMYREKTTNTTLENDLKIIIACKALIDEKDYEIIKNEDLNARTLKGEECRVIPIGDNYVYNILEKQYVENQEKLYKVDSDIYVLNIDKIKEKAKEIFNTDVNIEKHSYESTSECLMYDENTYKYFKANKDKNTFWKEESKLLKATKCGDEIYIYDNYIKATYNEEFYNIYATSDKAIHIRKITNKYNLGEQTLAKLPILEVKLPVYKHTFKLGANGTLYWKSTELMNKNEFI